ncbi:MAG: hypothetical protein PHW86_05235 [Candidatus Bipolaricaulis sp.]|nr:hypothetical protein [Candidatus Bipolaricaulis sp.]
MSRGAWALLAVCLASVSAEAPSGDVDLSGRWAMVQAYPELATLPLVGETLRTTVVTQLVEIVQTGSLLSLRDTYCSTVVDDGTVLVKTEIPEAFLRALRPGPRYASLAPISTGGRFVQDEYVEVRGARLANPGEDPLPTSPSDPRVIDQDGDGFPGMSIRIRMLGFVDGTAYVVQRVRYTLEGTIVDADTIRGTIGWSTEQVVLGASTPVLRTDAPSRPHPDSSRSAFLMTRVDSSADCDVLRQRRSEWLGVLDVPLP